MVRNAAIFRFFRNGAACFCSVGFGFVISVFAIKAAFSVVARIMGIFFITRRSVRAAVSWRIGLAAMRRRIKMRVILARRIFANAGFAGCVMGIIGRFAFFAAIAAIAV